MLSTCCSHSAHFAAELAAAAEELEREVRNLADTRAALDRERSSLAGSALQRQLQGSRSGSGAGNRSDAELVQEHERMKQREAYVKSREAAVEKAAEALRRREAAVERAVAETQVRAEVLAAREGALAQREAEIVAREGEAARALALASAKESEASATAEAARNRAEAAGRREAELAAAEGQLAVKEGQLMEMAAKATAMVESAHTHTRKQHEAVAVATFKAADQEAQLQMLQQQVGLGNLDGVARVVVSGSGPGRIITAAPVSLLAQGPVTAALAADGALAQHPPLAAEASHASMGSSIPAPLPSSTPIISRRGGKAGSSAGHGGAAGVGRQAHLQQQQFEQGPAHVQGINSGYAQAEVETDSPVSSDAAPLMGSVPPKAQQPYASSSLQRDMG